MKQTIHQHQVLHDFVRSQPRKVEPFPPLLSRLLFCVKLAFIGTMLAIIFIGAFAPELFK